MQGISTSLGRTSRGGWLLSTLALIFLLTGSSPVIAATESATVQSADAETLYVQEEEVEVEDFLTKVDIEEELVRSNSTTTQEAASVWDESIRSIDAAAVSFPASCPEVQLLRIAPSAYDDGISDPAGASRWGARYISNEVLAQSGSIPSPNRESDMLWQFGQFVDHDIDLTRMDSSEPLPIEVPLGDPFFDPGSMGGKLIPFDRSVFDPTTGTSTSNPRQQVNQITGFIDASNVYGCDDATARSLRTLDGTGQLKVSAGNLLPLVGGFFVAGDIRVNEQVALSAMHTLWMREHNFWARRLRNHRPSMTGDDIYEAARNVVMAELQIIAYQDFLPKLLGSGAIPSYSGYDSTVDPRIANEFSTAAYRLGHTMLSGDLLRLKADGTPIAAGPLPLRDAFFVPGELIGVGVSPYMKGLASQIMQRIDSKIVDDVRNFLFGDPTIDGLDLGSLNIQRGRDHGLPDYNTVRDAYGLAKVGDFDEITLDTTVQTQLFTAYGDVDDIDVWVGALAEDPVSGALVGELLYAALVDQFTRLRDGDIEWYENRLNPGAARSLENQTLAKVIARNTPLLRSDLQADVFIVP